MATPLAGRSMTERMMGAALLDVATYEEVEADTTATSHHSAPGLARRQVLRYVPRS